MLLADLNNIQLIQHKDHRLMQVDDFVHEMLVDIADGFVGVDQEEERRSRALMLSMARM